MSAILSELCERRNLAAISGLQIANNDDGCMKIPVRTLPIRFENEDQIGTPASIEIDIDALQEDLESEIQGEVRFDDGTRAMYAHDASNYRQVPIAVVIPETKGDIIKAVKIARKHKVP